MMKRHVPTFLTAVASAPVRAEDIRDIKPPVNLPFGNAWIWGGLALVVLVAAIVWGSRLWSRRKAAAALEAGPRKSPWELAWERLETLQRQNLIAAGRVKEYYVQLSDIVRHYLEDRFQLRAPEMTTDEFLNLLQSSPVLTEAHKQSLKDFLNACDMVKFAKYGSNASEAEQGFNFARRLIEETRPQPEPEGPVAAAQTGVRK